MNRQIGRQTQMERWPDRKRAIKNFLEPGKMASVSQRESGKKKRRNDKRFIAYYKLTVHIECCHFILQSIITWCHLRTFNIANSQYNCYFSYWSKCHFANFHLVQKISRHIFFSFSTTGCHFRLKIGFASFCMPYGSHSGFPVKQWESMSVWGNRGATWQERWIQIIRFGGWNKAVRKGACLAGVVGCCQGGSVTEASDAWGVFSDAFFFWGGKRGFTRMVVILGYTRLHGLGK